MNDQALASVTDHVLAGDGACNSGRDALRAQDPGIDAARQRLHDLFMQAPAHIQVYRGPNHIVELINQRATEFIGPREAVGRPVREVFPEVEGQGFFELLDTVYRTGEPFAGSERRILIRRHGAEALQEAFFDFVYQPSRNAAGKVDGVLVFGFDVSDQVRAREALRESEQRLAAIVDQAAVGIAQTDFDGRFVLANDRYCEIVGRPQAELLSGLRMQEITHPDDLPENLELFGRMLREGAPFAIEKRYVRPDGAQVWVRNTVSRVDDASGAPRFVLAVSEDITARIRAEEALRESEQRFRNMADHAPVMLWVTNADAACTYLNRQWYDFTGQTPATSLGFGWLEAVHPEDRGWSGELFQDANRHQRAFQLEYRLRRHDGVYRWAIDAAAPRFGADGAFLGYIGSVIDITERKRAEEARAQSAQIVLESEQRYRMLFEAAAVSIWEEDFSAVKALVDELKAQGVTDVDAYLDERPEVVNAAIELIQIRDVNAHTLDMFDATSKEELLDSLGTIFLPETARIFQGEMVAIAEGRRTFVAEAPLRTVRGERRDVLVTIAFPEPSGRFDRIPVTLTDITERKRADQERYRLEYEKDAFLATASHDLKNPLASIKGNAQLIRRHIARGAIDPARLVTGLESIDTSVAQMVGLIDALLDLTRLRMGRQLELELSPTDLVDLARHVVAEQAVTSERHQIVVEATEAEIIGMWDVRRLERVLGNLLSNAIKYSPHGGSITVSVAREAQAQDRWAVLRVRDHGLGIPARDLPHIFEHFHRAANVVGSIAGTGIGLAGARQIVEQHGGTITVDSREGAGSTFTLHLPLTVAPEAREERVCDQRSVPDV